MDIEEYEDYEVCTFCGQRIKGVVDWSNDGDPYCQGCIADEEATKTDHAYEMYRDRRDFPEYYKKQGVRLEPTCDESDIGGLDGADF